MNKRQLVAPAEPMYPEHEKLRAVSERSQAIGEFLDWLRTPKEDGGKGVHLHTWEEWEEDDLCPVLGCRDGKLNPGKLNPGRSYERDCQRCGGTGLVKVEREGWMPLRPGVEKLLAEFFDINLAKLEDEKRAMLDNLRALNERGA